MKKLVIVFLTIGCISSFLNSCKEDDFELPYQLYSSLVTQSGENIPVEKVLINEQELSVEWSRIRGGVFQATLSRPLELDKTTMIFQLSDWEKIAVVEFTDSVTLLVLTSLRSSPNNTTDDFSNATLEIKSFK